jgi:hypothetical protein
MPPPNFPQRYDFKGLTPNDYMDMDLSPIFGLNSRFGAVLGGITHFSALASLTLAENLGLSKSKWGLRLLGPSGRRRSGFAGQVSLSHWASCASVRVVTDDCDEKSVVDKEFAACGSHVG